jgi:hypothetical protein
MHRSNIRRGLSEIEAAEYTGLSRSTLRQGRMYGPRLAHVPPPPFVKVGRKVIYLRDDLDHFLEIHRTTHEGGERNCNPTTQEKSRMSACSDAIEASGKVDKSSPSENRNR